MSVDKMEDIISFRISCCCCGGRCPIMLFSALDKSWYAREAWWFSSTETSLYNIAFVFEKEVLLK